MSYVPSIQAYNGPNTSNSSGLVETALDWIGHVYVWGVSATSSGTLADQGVNSGVELQWQPASAYSGAFKQNPSCVDSAGFIYVGKGFPPGGIIQIDPAALALVQAGAVGFPSQLGSMCPVSDGTHEWILATGLGGTGGFEVFSAFSTSSLAAWGLGNINFLTSNASCCPSVKGNGLGYVFSGPNNSGLTQRVNIWQVNITTPSQALVKQLIPSDIDGTWTTITQQGCCVDLTDGNLLIAVGGNGSTKTYLVKLNVSTWAVVWKAALPNAGGGSQMGQSVVANQRFYHLGTNSGVQTCTTVDTSTGATTSYTSGLNHLVMFGGQASNDNLGTIFGIVQLSTGSGGPVLRNSTPSAFTGASMIYVASPLPGPPVGSGTRKFIAELGPVKITL